MMKNGRARTILSEVTEAVGKWRDFAAEVDVAPDWRAKIEATHRLKIA